MIPQYYSSILAWFGAYNEAAMSNHDCPVLNGN